MTGWRNDTAREVLLRAMLLRRVPSTKASALLLAWRGLLLVLRDHDRLLLLDVLLLMGRRTERTGARVEAPPSTAVPSSSYRWIPAHDSPTAPQATLACGKHYKARSKK